VAKAELGTKRICPNCGTRYYDLGRNPIVCPKCGTVFEVVAATRARPAPAKPVPEEEVEVVAEKGAEFVSLEEADDEAADSGAVKVEGEEEEIEGDDDEADDTFLEEEEEGDEDVGDIIGDVDEEER
jgi:uncharacterized protein (TIGR02300 family)